MSRCVISQRVLDQFAVKLGLETVLILPNDGLVTARTWGLQFEKQDLGAYNFSSTPLKVSNLTHTLIL
jgi:hypothetical protein